MTAWQCGLCSHVYDEARESAKWNELPADWVCPICGSPRSSFTVVEAAGSLGRLRTGIGIAAAAVAAVVAGRHPASRLGDPETAPVREAAGPLRWKPRAGVGIAAGGVPLVAAGAAAPGGELA